MFIKGIFTILWAFLHIVTHLYLTGETKAFQTGQKEQYKV